MAVGMLARKHYWAMAGVVSLAAFVLGAAAYTLLGIVLAQREAGAFGAGFQQVTVAAQLDDLVLKFAHDQLASGSGEAHDPFVLYHYRVRMVVGVVGEGMVTVEDQHGNVLWELEKVGARRLRAAAGYEEYMIEIELPEKVGEYQLSVKLNGVSAVGPNVRNPIHFSYRTVPILPEMSDGAGVPSVPATGGAPVLYVGGYGVQTVGVLWSGGVVGLIVLLWFVVVALRRQRAEAGLVRGRKVAGRKIRREISPKKLGKVK